MSTETDLVLRSDQTFFDQRQVAALKSMGIAQDTPNADLAIFFHHAKRTGLDPFARQIYLLQRNAKNQKTGQWETKSTIQTGIDGYRLIARKAAQKLQTDYDYGPTEWCGEDGEWRDVWAGPGAPIAARVTVYVGEKNRQFPAIAHYSEYVQLTKDGEPTSMWKKMAASQLAKCGESLALRKAFPLDLSGIYTDDEMAQADADLADLGETSGAPAPAAADAPKVPVQRKPRAKAAAAPAPAAPEPEGHAPAPEPEDLGEKDPDPDADADGVVQEAEVVQDPAAPDPEDPTEPPEDYDSGPAAVLEADAEPEAAPTTAPEPAKAEPFKQCTPGQFRKMVDLAKEAYPDQPSMLEFLGRWFSDFRKVKVTQIPGPQDTSRDEAAALTKHLEQLLAGELPGV